MKKTVSFAMGLLAVCLSLSAQNISVSGWVKDANDNEPVISCAVKQVGAENATLTDNTGYYNISVPRNATLKFEAMCYITQCVPVNGRIRIDVLMVFDGPIITPSSLYAGIRFQSVMDNRDHLTDKKEKR